MEYWYLWVIPVVGGLLWFIISNAIVKAPGTALQAKFSQLTADTNGVIAGKTLAEIKAKCGAPSAVSAMQNGKTLYQWQATGYHIALVFDENDICEGISSEIKI